MYAKNCESWLAEDERIAVYSKQHNIAYFFSRPSSIPYAILLYTLNFTPPIKWRYSSDQPLVNQIANRRCCAT